MSKSRKNLSLNEGLASGWKLWQGASCSTASPLGLRLSLFEVTVRNCFEEHLYPEMWILINEFIAKVDAVRVLSFGRCISHEQVSCIPLQLLFASGTNNRIPSWASKFLVREVKWVVNMYCHQHGTIPVFDWLCMFWQSKGWTVWMWLASLHLWLFFFQFCLAPFALASCLCGRKLWWLRWINRQRRNHAHLVDILTEPEYRCSISECSVQDLDMEIHS